MHLMPVIWITKGGNRGYHMVFFFRFSYLFALWSTSRFSSLRCCYCWCCFFFLQIRCWCFRCMTPASKRFPELRERDHAILSQVNFIEILLMSTFGESHSIIMVKVSDMIHFGDSNKSVQLVSADDPISVSINAFEVEPDEVSEGGDRAVEWSLLLGSETATTLSPRWITLWLLTRCSSSHTLQSFGSDHGLRI